MNSEEKQLILDEERLRWLGFFHYISGVVTIGFSSMFIFHLIFFGFITTNPEFFGEQFNTDESIEGLKIIKAFLWVFSGLVVLGITFGVLELISGYYIRKKKHRTFSFIVAIPRMLFIPYGTVLSVLTVMLLDQKSVKKIYEKREQ